MLRLCRRRLSANVTSRIALAIATPTAMIAPMNDWMFSVVPVRKSITTTPAIAAGAVETVTSDSRHDWKLAASSRKIDDDGHAQSDAPGR